MSDVNPSPVATTRTQRRALRLGLWAGVVGPVTFFVVFTIDGALKPGYSALRDAVSYLALGPYGWIQTLNFIFLGLCVIAFGFALFNWWRRVVPSRLIVVGSVLIALSGVGYILAALFTAHRPPQPPGPLHTLAFEVVFFAQGFGCLLIGLRMVREPGWRWIGWLSFAIAFFTVVAALGNLSSLLSQAPATPISSPSGAFPLGGLFNRVLVALAFIWYLVLATKMLKGGVTFAASKSSAKP
ncbi:MAG TPA: DUF998 domain-containing protein [Ktedonobacteraceae bacterium]